MKNNIRVSSEKDNSTYNIKAIFQQNFKKQIKNYIEIYEIHTGKKIKKSVVKNNLLQYLSDNYYSNYDLKSVSKWYTGKNLPLPEVIVLIAKFFNCTTDELLMNKNPYDKGNQEMREKGFSEEAIKKIELLLRKPPKAIPLFGEIIESKFGSFEFLNDLICNQNIDELIRYYIQISKEFFDLTKEDVEKINTIIPELKESIYRINNIQILKDLLFELPEPIKNNVQKIKSNMDSYINLHTAIYILKLYKKATQHKII